MSKKLFKNYSFDFDKNEKKVLINFCKQAIKQMSGDEKFYAEIRTHNSIIEKLNFDSESVKLTKEEKTKLTFQLKENVKYIKVKISKSWFIKKWLYSAMFKEYNNILSKHFSE